MVGLFHFQPPSEVARLRVMVVMSYNLAIATLFAVDADSAVPNELSRRVGELAAAVAEGNGEATESNGAVTGPSLRAAGPWHSVDALISHASAIAGGGALPELNIPQPPKARSGLFLPDAFQNPDHFRYALKGTLAVTICYLTFALLDWPGIHTCMLTCFIVGLTTVGESTQKLLLRISGCLVGAVFGLLAIVYILPGIESISALILLIGIVTLPAAWVAVGRPSVSYIGFQAAFALYLCILQGDEPKFDLTIIRDRTIGILFGNLIVYLIFTNIFPVSTLSKVRKELSQILARSRDLLHGIGEPNRTLETGWRAAALQASLASAARSASALAYESLNSPIGRREREAIDRSIASLQDMIEMVCRIALFSSLQGEPATIGVGSRSAMAESRLAVLAESLTDPTGAITGSGLNIVPDDGQRDAAASTAALWSGSFARLEDSLRRLSSAIGDYRELLRIEAQANA
jgi:multidrug resistance protein MdtO